ncbi:MAG: FAD-dependent oxidoreductase [Rhizobiaceae bacterium]
MKRDRRLIAIAGAGIAGMTAALFLERAGFRVLLFEKAEQPASSGTGIQISPNAYKVLDELGLARSVATVGFAPESIEISSGQGGNRLTEFQLGEACLQRHGAPYTTIHRVDLAQILLTACEDREDIEIRRGAQVADLTVHANGLTLLCETKDDFSEEYVVSAVIGADGAWSTLRKFVHDSQTPEFTGHVAWRSLVDISAAGPAVSRTSTGLWLGPNAHLVHYPVRDGNLLNIIAITPWDKDYAPRRGWLQQSAADDRISAFHEWQPHLRDLVGVKADWGGWPIFASKKVGCFANGPLCLIGDAAHAMVPYGAQGGASAIEDAYVLGALCNQMRDDLEGAFKLFEQLRRPRVQKVMQLSRNNRRIYHLKSPASWARNMVMSLLPQESLQKRMDWLYGWQPTPPDVTQKPKLALLDRLSSLWLHKGGGGDDGGGENAGDGESTDADKS